jgi:hypothetical protein
MKIDPVERSLPLSRPVADKAKSSQSLGGFDSVLQNTLEKSSASNRKPGSLITSIRGPLAPTAVQTNSKIHADTAAENLLDKLEDYQQMLADPANTLKMIQPAVDQMEKQAAGTRELISTMPEGHPLKAIIQDTIANISQEIEKFNSGRYVDQ